MDTKLKNSRYVLPAALALLLTLSLSLLTVVDLYDHREYLREDYYFDSQSFFNELYTEVDLIQSVHVDFAGYPNKQAQDKLSAEVVKQIQTEQAQSLRERQQTIRDEYESRIQEAQRAGNANEVARLTKEQTAKLAEAAELVRSETEDRLNELIKEQDQEYEERSSSLTLRDGSFKYYIRDAKRGTVYTNLDHEPTAAELRDAALFFYQFPQSSAALSRSYADLNRSFQLKQWKGIIYVPRISDGYSQILADAVYYNSIQDRLMAECTLLAGTLLASAGLLWYTVKHRAVQLPVAQRILGLLRRIPVDIRIVLLLPAIVIYLSTAFNVNFFAFPIGLEQIFTMIVMLPLTAFFLLYVIEGWYICSNPEQLHAQWQKSLLFRQRALLQESYSNRSVFFKVALIFTLTVGLGMSVALGFVALVERIEALLVPVFLYGMFYAIFVLPYIFRRIALLNRVLLGASQMAAGDLNTTIVEKPRGKLADLAHSLNNIKQGLQRSVESQMKSERLKSELITNVSHDLKTPLTSIINYVDLLKRDDLTPEDIKSYVDILERKTNRLKVLIDDLFEAAKTASGSVELNIEQVNVSALLNQAIAEFSDKTEESALTFRVNIEQPKIYAPLDGKKTWRVFENLIGNALKYSMPHTRVHIHLAEKQDEVILSIKNVSAYEIDFAADELFERFKRGDQSRNTEGSGLGLAIAKSIVELQGGTLHIDIDGDYFKVIVTFRR
ncbi:histidine kinase dimerization/phospho-acceptor domain-containing protein [Brevibacillus sp. GCM10020057]|uniref:histidine kinase dimerization/phospho-acceptor domain-containing protein n=1 Tax=Brevibacillus sp. GCM10020057 TaxID=3317327 RepID=UPI00363A3958